MLELSMVEGAEEVALHADDLHDRVARLAVAIDLCDHWNKRFHSRFGGSDHGERPFPRGYIYPLEERLLRLTQQPGPWF